MQPALRPRDQVDDLRRVRRDHARPRRLLRTILEIELDRLLLEVEAEVGKRFEADLDGALLRVRRLERREPADVRGVEGRRHRLTLRPEQPVEPALAQRAVRIVDGAACAREDVGEPAQRDALLLLVSVHGLGIAGDVRLELLAGPDELEPPLVERGGDVRLQVAQLFALAVVGKHRELRLGGAKRQLLALERHLGRQQRVLELVGLRRELGRDDPAFARLEQAIQALALGLGRVRFCLAERVQLRRARRGRRSARRSPPAPRSPSRPRGRRALPPSARERTGGDAIRTPRACGPPQQPYAESIRWRVPA